MPGTPQIAVTPQRVADGDPAALVRLVDRRARAVLGFCETVCTLDVAPLAAAEAFARFRAAVHAASDPRSLDPETLLHGATRHAAGAMARSASSETRRRLGRRSDEHLRCIPTPSLLAARADNMLGVAEDERLSEHLQRCAGCRAVEARFNRAEQAYARRASGEIDPMTFLSILEALHDAAPVAPQYAADWDEVLAAWAKQAGVEEATDEPELPAAAVAADELEIDDEPEFDDEPELDNEPEIEEPAFDEPEIVDVDVEEPELEAPALEEAEVDEPQAEELEPEPEPAYVEEPYAEEHDDHRYDGVLPARQSFGIRRPPLRGAVTAGRTMVSGVLFTTRGRDLPRPFRHAPHEIADHGPIYRYVLPATALLVAALIILAVAGVFSAGGG